MVNGMNDPRSVAARRWKMALLLSALMIVIYFGFVLLIAFDKEAMGALMMPGLSVGIAMGVLVIVLTWAVTWFYVFWTRRNIDEAVTRMSTKGGQP